MTLKEKFKKIDIKISKNHSTLLTNREADIIEKIADEFAIGFADWKDKFISEIDDWKQDGVYLKNSYTTKELLEIYKKEKGL